eukprot:gene2901-3050_t
MAAGPPPAAALDFQRALTQGAENFFAKQFAHSSAGPPTSAPSGPTPVISKTATPRAHPVSPPENLSHLADGYGPWGAFMPGEGSATTVSAGMAYHIFRASVACEAIYDKDPAETVSKMHPGLFQCIFRKEQGKVVWGEFYAEHPATLYVAFRGTMPPSMESWQDTFWDVMADFSIRKHGEYSLGQMHGGFLQRANA